MNISSMTREEELEKMLEIIRAKFKDTAEKNEKLEKKVEMLEAKNSQMQSARVSLQEVMAIQHIRSYTAAATPI